ncbi:Gfo/Idh/MocA family protein [Bauldia sp.]|uniref:Gfo/Idh/MocA family protein n=1 Tax=Bauldia sp. TaxID=2575872 RepID=UPI003BA8831B
MTSKRPLGIGVIGLGMGATPHAKSLKDMSDRVTVRGVFARDRDRREAFAGKFGFPAAESVDAIADDPDVDAVLLLTPPNARAELVDRLSATGKHILMEKPIERTTSAAEALVAQCEDRGVRLGLVFQQRLRPNAEQLRALLADGGVGAIAAVRLEVPWWRPQAGYYDQPGRGSLERDGGGVLLSQAIHALDLMLSVTAPVTEVQAVTGTTALHQMETEDFAAAGLRFGDGALGALMATTAAYPGAGEQLALDCANAGIVLKGRELTVNWHDGRVEVHEESGGVGAGADPMDFPHDWHLALITDFLDAVEAGRDPTVTARDGLKVHRLIDALLESSRTKRAVVPAGG